MPFDVSELRRLAQHLGCPSIFRVIVCAIICSDFDRPLAGQSDKELPPAREQTGGLGMRFYRQSGAVVTPTDARSIGFMHTIHRFSESRMMGQPPGGELKWLFAAN